MLYLIDSLEGAAFADPFQALVKVSAEVSQYHKGCYLEKSYEIKCLSSTTSGKLAPFLSINDNKEVMSISLPEVEAYYPRERTI